MAPSKQTQNELLIIFLQKYECSGHSYDKIFIFFAALQSWNKSTADRHETLA